MFSETRTSIKVSKAFKIKWMILTSNLLRYKKFLHLVEDARNFTSTIINVCSVLHSSITSIILNLLLLKFSSKSLNKILNEMVENYYLLL